MATNSPEHEQRFTPYLSYDDAPAAIEFLCTAFGFEERFRLPITDGRIGHAELACYGHIVMLASTSEMMGFVSPRRLLAVHSQVHVHVDDVDTHYQRSLAAGATIATAPRDQYGARMYRAMDPEGHRWIFSMPLTGGAGKDATAQPRNSDPTT